MQFTAQGIGAGSTLRSGDAVTLLSFSYTRGIAGAATMRAASTGPISSQVPVHGCGAPSIITASTDMLQNPAPKK